MSKELLVVLTVKEKYSKQNIMNDIVKIEILEELKPYTRILTDPPMGKLKTIRKPKKDKKRRKKVGYKRINLPKPMKGTRIRVNLLKGIIKEE